MNRFQCLLEDISHVIFGVLNVKSVFVHCHRWSFGILVQGSALWHFMSTLQASLVYSLAATGNSLSRHLLTAQLGHMIWWGEHINLFLPLLLLLVFSFLSCSFCPSPFFPGSSWHMKISSCLTLFIFPILCWLIVFEMSCQMNLWLVTDMAALHVATI